MLRNFKKRIPHYHKLQIKGTLPYYEEAWRKWASWCLEQKIYPLQAHIKNIIEDLSFLFDYDNKYITIYFHRSAIAAFHEYIDCLPVEKRPRICSVVSGIFNLRPLKPRYMLMWCVKQVRYVFEEKFGNNPQLPNKDLTLKVFCAFKSTILLALRTSSRISALRILQLNYMIKTTEYYDIRLHKLYKS